MTPQKAVQIMNQGETAGRGMLYRLADCPFTPDSRKAKLWSAGFAAGHLDRNVDVNATVSELKRDDAGTR